MLRRERETSMSHGLAILGDERLERALEMLNHAHHI